MARKMNRWLGVAAAGVCSVALAACSNTANAGGDSANGAGGTQAAASQNMTPQGASGRPSLDKFCGSKPAKVAYIVGFGENAWRKTALAEIQDEAKKCDNVTVTYLNANGDQNQYLSMVNSATAQGYNAIITYDDFGAAAVPALRQAFNAGLAVVPWEADPTGKVGQDYTGFVAMDTAYETKEWTAYFQRALLNGGKIAFLGGPPGAPLSQGYWKDFTANLKQVNDLKLEGSGPITTNWTPADSQKAASGLFSQFPHTAGVIADYLGGSGPATVNAFVNAKQPLVPIAGGSATNELVCQYHQFKASNPKFDLFSMDGDIAMGRVALRKAVAAYEGLNDDESWLFRRSVGIDTTKNVVPACEKDLPPDLPLNSTLSDDQLAKVFGR